MKKPALYVNKTGHSHYVISLKITKSTSRAKGPQGKAKQRHKYRPKGLHTAQKRSESLLTGDIKTAVRLNITGYILSDRRPWFLIGASVLIARLRESRLTQADIMADCPKCPRAAPTETDDHLR